MFNAKLLGLIEIKSEFGGYRRDPTPTYQRDPPPRPPATQSGKQPRAHGAAQPLPSGALTTVSVALLP